MFTGQCKWIYFIYKIYGEDLRMSFMDVV